MTSVQFEKKEKSEIKPLTSIRGVAAFLVMVYHYHQLNDFSYPAVNHFIRHGYLWVDLFFVLSGFVMAMTYADLFVTRFSLDAYKKFLGKRLARVYPIYFVITIGVSLYSLVIYGGFSHVHRPAVNLEHPVLAHVANLLLFQAWGFGENIGGPTWSISAEWAAYLLFPLLVQLALFRQVWMAWGIGLIAATLLIFIATHPETGQTVRNGQLDIYHCRDAFVVMRCIGGFTLGLIAFRLRLNVTIMRILANDYVCIVLFMLLLLLMSSGVEDLAIYPLLPLLVISLYSVRGFSRTFFSARPFYAVGVLSYSIYLIHAHFLVLLEQLILRLPAYGTGVFTPFIASAITYGFVFLGATLAYRLIEKPGRAWLGKIATARR